MPHPPEVLAHVARLHMEIEGEDAEVSKFVKEIKVRTQVILKLGKELIENHHPALTKKGTGGTRVLKADAAELGRRCAARCEEYHPTPEDNDGKVDGVIPAAVMRIVKAGMTAKQTAAPLQAKNAIQPAGISAPEHVFDGVQPQAVVLQRTLGTAVEANEPMVAAFGTTM